MFFGVVTMVTESDPSFATQWHDYLLPLQQWMNEWAKGLTMLWGRGLFYVFQGGGARGHHEKAWEKKQ